MEDCTNYPWIVDNTGSGKNWAVCNVGKSSIDGKDYEVTTDRVHASELDGDARLDAYLIAKAPELFDSTLAMSQILLSMWGYLSSEQQACVLSAKKILGQAIAPKLPAKVG